MKVLMILILLAQMPLANAAPIDYIKTVCIEGYKYVIVVNEEDKPIAIVQQIKKSSVSSRNILVKCKGG